MHLGKIATDYLSMDPEWGKNNEELDLKVPIDGVLPS